MIEIYTVGMFWGSRPETLAASVDRSAQVLTRLAQVDPVLANWVSTLKVKGKKRQIALPHDRTLLEQLLLQGRNREGLGPVIEELGYHITTWSGPSPQESANLSLMIGTHAPRVGNACTLQLPHADPALSRLLTVPKLVELMTPMVTHLEPEWGRAHSMGIFNHPAIRAAGVNQVGWLTYLPVDPAKVPDLPAPSRVVPLATGSLIVATDERFDTANPAHMEALLGVHRALAGGGLLG